MALRIWPTRQESMTLAGVGVGVVIGTACPAMSIRMHDTRLKCLASESV